MFPSPPSAQGQPPACTEHQHKWWCFLAPAEPQLMSCYSSSPSGWRQLSFLRFIFPSDTRRIISPVTLRFWLDTKSVWTVTLPRLQFLRVQNPKITCLPCAHNSFLMPPCLLLITAISSLLHPNPSCLLPLTSRCKANFVFMQTRTSAPLAPRLPFLGRSMTLLLGVTLESQAG